MFCTTQIRVYGKYATNLLVLMWNTLNVSVIITGDLLPVTSSVSYLKHLTFGTLNQCDKLRNTFLTSKSKTN